MAPRTIDWQSIHRRLAVAEAAISGALTPGPDDVRRILEARARAAAKPPEQPDHVIRLDILTFSLSGETYGVETGRVREVCRLKDLTALPCTPPFVAGIMNLRGDILAVLDLRQFFQLPAKGLTDLNRVIVLKRGDDELGLLADSIDGVRTVPTTHLQGGLPTLTGIRERFLKGVTAQMLIVLDADRLLTDTGLKVNEQVAR